MPAQSPIRYNLPRAQRAIELAFDVDVAFDFDVALDVAFDVAFDLDFPRPMAEGRGGARPRSRADAHSTPTRILRIEFILKFPIILRSKLGMKSLIVGIAKRVKRVYKQPSCLTTLKLEWN